MLVQLQPDFNFFLVTISRGVWPDSRPLNTPAFF